MAPVLHAQDDGDEYSELACDIALLTHALRGHQPPRAMPSGHVPRTGALATLNHIATLLTTGRPGSPRLALTASIAAGGIKTTILTTDNHEDNANEAARWTRRERVGNLGSKPFDISRLKAYDGHKILAEFEGGAASFRHHAADIFSVIEAFRSKYPSDDEVVQFLIFTHMRSHRALATRLAAGRHIWPDHPARLLLAWADLPARAALRFRAVLRVENAEVSSWLTERHMPGLPGGKAFILDDDTVALWADALVELHDKLVQILLEPTGEPRRSIHPSMCPDLLAAVNRLRALLECGLIDTLMPDEHSELSSLLWTPSGSPRTEWLGTPALDANGSFTIELRDASADVNPEALRSIHETTAQHLIRYFRSLTAWFDSVLNITAPNRFLLPIHARLVHAAPVQISVSKDDVAAMRDAVLTDVPDWCEARAGVYMDGPGRVIPEAVEKTAVHAEAALMGLISEATSPAIVHGNPLAAFTTPEELRALQDEFSVERLAVGLPGRCCWTCSRLLVLLRRSLSSKSSSALEHVSIMGAHGMIEPWTPPATPQLPLEVLKTLRSELYTLLRGAAAAHSLGDDSTSEPDAEETAISWSELKASGLLAQLERFREVSDSEDAVSGTGPGKSGESEFEGMLVQDFPTDVAIAV